MSEGGYQSLTEFLKSVSGDADLQVARKNFRNAVRDSNLDPALKEALLRGDQDVVYRALADEYAEAERFILYFL